MSELMQLTAPGLLMEDQFSFNTKIADIQGNLYNTVTIGSQVWMVENLRTTRYNNNTPIPQRTGQCILDKPDNPSLLLVQ